MLDYYREREQRGDHVTQMPDHVRIEEKGGFVWEVFPDGHRRGHGPQTWQFTINVKEVPPGPPWWRRLFGKKQTDLHEAR